MKWCPRLSMNMHLATFAVCLALNACSSTPPAAPAQDLASILNRFEVVRDAMQLPHVRLSLEPNPFIAAAKGFGTLVMDEPFALSLSDPALNYVLMHEFAHLKHQDPRRGMETLRKIHASKGTEAEAETEQDFMQLWGKYNQEPEFLNMLREVEGRADEYAVDYLNRLGQDACAASEELELKTGRSFGDRIDAVCGRTQLNLE